MCMESSLSESHVWKMSPLILDWVWNSSLEFIFLYGFEGIVTFHLTSSVSVRRVKPFWVLILCMWLSPFCHQRSEGLFSCSAKLLLNPFRMNSGPSLLGNFLEFVNDFLPLVSGFSFWNSCSGIGSPGLIFVFNFSVPTTSYFLDFLISFMEDFLLIVLSVPFFFN